VYVVILNIQIYQKLIGPNLNLNYLKCLNNFLVTENQTLSFTNKDKYVEKKNTCELMKKAVLKNLLNLYSFTLNKFNFNNLLTNCQSFIKL